MRSSNSYTKTRKKVRKSWCISVREELILMFCMITSPIPTPTPLTKSRTRWHQGDEAYLFRPNYSKVILNLILILRVATSMRQCRGERVNLTFLCGLIPIQGDTPIGTIFLSAMETILALSGFQSAISGDRNRFTRGYVIFNSGSEAVCVLEVGGQLVAPGWQNGDLRAEKTEIRVSIR